MPTSTKVVRVETDASDGTLTVDIRVYRPATGVRLMVAVPDVNDVPSDIQLALADWLGMDIAP